jgi:hypothetical protein
MGIFENSGSGGNVSSIKSSTGTATTLQDTLFLQQYLTKVIKGSLSGHHP